MNYKYVLIASQYFHDYNFMTLELKWDENTYWDKMQGFLKELLQYKNPDYDGYLGDFDEDYRYNGLKRVHHIIDRGDIHIVHSETLEGMIMYLLKYERERAKLEKGYKKKDILIKINNHHNSYEVKRIFKKYFED
ncbi:MAG: hypothetical protein ACRC1T_09400 [Clostridium chrysemydis]|uniref:hypothetical protein n=1 Tax=Clostridium chrysemydis TaxID=2665504 RepID=UPI003F31DBBB